jgi:polyisoprenoid-binding protein YceI
MKSLHSLPSLFAVCAALTLPASGAHAQRVTAVDLNRSAITFLGKQMNVPTEGKFVKFAAQLAFDPAKPADSRVQVEVDLASIDTGSVEGDDEVKGKAWFDVKNHPTAKFTSSSVKNLGGGRFEVTGKMSLKGRVRDVTAPFTFKPDAQGGLFEGTFVLKRLDYGIGEGPWADVETVADEVQVKFRLAARKA